MAILELHKNSKEKDAEHRLVVRFKVGSQTYRIGTGQRLTEKDWAHEQKKGYHKTRTAVEMESRIRRELSKIDKKAAFDINSFRELLSKKEDQGEDLNKIWKRYTPTRDHLALNTTKLDGNMKSSLMAFIAERPDLADVTLWTVADVRIFHTHLLDTVPTETTAKIYLVHFKTFFNWMVNNDIAVKTLFGKGKYEIPEIDENWHPYSNQELALMLKAEPASGRIRESWLWFNMILFSGGSDPRDFCSLQWRRVGLEQVSISRVKVRGKSQSGIKVVPIIGGFGEAFTELAGQRKSDDDYVFNVFKKGNTESQDTNSLRSFMKRINKDMNKLLRNAGVRFTIKRLRPSAAVLALDSTHDINFVKSQLGHSNIKTTDVYLRRLPSEAKRKNQERFNDAIKGLVNDPGSNNS